MVRLMFALAALVMFVPVAHAASFDCNKAGTSFEKAICASPDLSKADETLAKAYATALGGLSTEAAATVKATQHNWLDYAARVCSDDAEPIKGAYSDDQTQCLLSTFKDRLRALEASRMLGGYRFYPVEQYLVEKDTEATPDDYVKVATKHALTLRIDGDDDVASAFNAMTAEAMSARTELFDASGAFKLEDVTDDVDVSTTVEKVSDYRITLTTNDYWFGHGAAHGNYGITYRHLLVAEARPLVASDIFTGKGWQKALGKLVVAKLKAQLEDGYFSDSEADIPTWSADPSRWNFSYDGLIVQFQPYEVSAYAAGAVTVTIPWDDLRSMLTENGEAIATY